MTYKQSFMLVTFGTIANLIVAALIVGLAGPYSIWTILTAIMVAVTIHQNHQLRKHLNRETLNRNIINGVLLLRNILNSRALFNINVAAHAGPLAIAIIGHSPILIAMYGISLIVYVRMIRAAKLHTTNIINQYLIRCVNDHVDVE